MAVFVGLTEKGMPFTRDTLDQAAGQQSGEYAARQWDRPAVRQWLGRHAPA